MPPPLACQNGDGSQDSQSFLTDVCQALFSFENVKIMHIIVLAKQGTMGYAHTYLFTIYFFEKGKYLWISLAIDLCWGFWRRSPKCFLPTHKYIY